MARVGILDDYQGIALSMADWKGLPAGSEVTAFRDHLADEDALVQRLAGFEVVVAMRERTPFPGRLLQRLPSLKLLVTTGGRNASIDLAAAHEHGIVVCGTRSLATPTSELTWGLILGLVRNIPAEDRSIRDGGWQTGAGPSLEGKTLGVMGLGNLGTRVTSVALAFGMEVIAWSQNLTAERAEAAGARLVTKDELLAQSDVLTIHLVLSDRTRGIVSRRDLDLMKPTAYLVNTSRGPIVDEQALVESLVAGRIAGAAIDVFDEEPLPAGHPLRSLPNTVVTPHIGYVTADNYRLFYGDVVEDINAFYAGQPIRLLQPSQ
jgi:phosphoglycerate dehydrogenase-like enzyme